MRSNLILGCEMNNKFKALDLVEAIFKNDADKGGEPYIGHLMRVSNRFLNNDDILSSGFVA